MKKNQNKKGFTLVELIVVIAILAVLGLLLVPQVTGYIKASKDAVGTANAKACYSSIAAKRAGLDSGITINVTVDAKCDPLPAGADAKDGPNLTGATYTADNGVYSFDGTKVTVPTK